VCRVLEPHKVPGEHSAFGVAHANRIGEQARRRGYKVGAPGRAAPKGGASVRRRSRHAAPLLDAISSVSARTLPVVARDEPTWLPVTCAGCGHRWYGIERAHCASCHRTFAALDLFDQHRVDHLCRARHGQHAKSGVWEPRSLAARTRRAS
jgi:hypothetical protein